MKRKRLPLFKISSFFFAATACASAAAFSEGEWKYRQGFTVERAGVLSLPVPLETLNHTQPDQRDLRIVGPDAGEIPFVLFEPEATPPHWKKPRQFQLTLADHASIITIDAGEERIWESLNLESTSPRFMKAARLEASHDGKTWEEWSDGLPFFRQDGAEQMSLILRKEPAAWFRVTLQDDGKTRIVVSGAKLLVPALEDNSDESVPLSITHIENASEETVLTLALPAANMDLKELRVTTPEPLFTRQIKLGFPELQDGEIVERIGSSDTIYRLAVEPGRSAEKIAFAVNSAIPGREIFLHFVNHDSPPLKIEKVEAKRRILLAGFSASAAGQYFFWSGNARTEAPHYDLATAQSSLRTFAPAKVAVGPLEKNSHYAEIDSLSGLGLEAGPISSGKWSSRRTVTLGQPGVQVLDLDLAALSSAQTNLADVRLVRGQKQVPYLLERTGLKRWTDLEAVADPDPARPNVSRWKITLPRPAARIAQISLLSPSTLFDRRIRILETREIPSGETYSAVLGSASWRRTQKNPTEALVATIEPPSGKAVFIEIENGDNPPIALSQVRASYILTRLVFRSESTEPIELLTGNLEVTTPQYDLALVAGTLISSEKHTAQLAAIENSPQRETSKKIPKSVLFWGALSVVVIALLAIVAKLLPKPADPKP